MKPENLHYCDILEGNCKALAASENRIKELDELIEKREHDDWQDHMDGNSDDDHIKELQEQLVEKDKEIEKLKASNSIYKALNERLKKGNEELKQENLDKAHLLLDIETDNKKLVDQALSELREDVKMFVCVTKKANNKWVNECAKKQYALKCELCMVVDDVLKAIDSRRTA